MAFVCKLNFAECNVTAMRFSCVRGVKRGRGAVLVGQRHQSLRRSSRRGDGKPFEWLRRPLNPSRAVMSGGRHSAVAP
jgi:hypothetical protein